MVDEVDYHGMIHAIMSILLSSVGLPFREMFLQAAAATRRMLNGVMCSYVFSIFSAITCWM